MVKILHINTSEDAVLDLKEFKDQQIEVDSCNSLLEGIVASRQNDYDAIVFDEKAESLNGLDVLNTLRQNDIRTPLVYTNSSQQQVQVYEQSNRRRFDLERETTDQTISSFISNLEVSGDTSSPLSFNQLQQIVDASAVPVIVLNQYASIMYANRMACDFLQFDSPLELYNNSLNRIFPLKSALSGRKDIPSLISERAAEDQSFFWEVVDRNGGRKCVSVRAHRISDQGPVTTMLQFLIGSEARGQEAEDGKASEEIIRVVCKSKIMRSGLEMALSNTKHFFEFEEMEDGSFDEETFTGSTMAVYACSHFNHEELELLQSMVEHAGDRPSMVVALAAEPEAVKKALAAGVRGFILGENELEMMQGAIQVLGTGGLWLSPEMAVNTVDQAPEKPRKKINNEIIDQLTKREKQVLSMLATGMKNHDIADSLELSYRTVVTHVYNIYRKLNLSSRTEAIHLAIASGLVDVDSKPSGK